MATTTLGPAAAASAGTSNNNFQSCLKVEESVVNELLLVCGVIGTTTTTTTTKDDTETKKKEEDDEERLVPVADCVLWLQDLQRALRRDEDAYRPIALLLAKWNIVPTKLLPLMKSSYYDSAMVMTLLKILVILTKPLTDSAKKAARMVIDVKAAAKKYPDDEKLQQLFIKEQGKLRANAIAQSNAILDHKRSVIQASRSSLGLLSSQQQQQQQRHTMLSAIVGLLTEPLSKSSGRKSDHDHLVIELVLHFIRNLLCAEPVIKPSSEIKEQSYRLQNELISVFHEELVLDIVLMLSQQMTEVVTRDSTYNLLLMEIIYHLIKHADPIAVAKWNPNMSSSTKLSSTSQPSKLGSGLLATSVLAAQQQQQHQPKSLRDKDTSISLRSVLSKERQRLHSSAISTSRHGHFGGTLMKLQTNKASGNSNSNDGSSSIGGKRTVLSSVLQTGGTSMSTAGSNAAAASSHEPAKMRGKGSMPFISEQKQERGGSEASSSSTFRSNRALHEFCRKFTTQGGYKNLMKSLKNEFRRDSHRLEDSDKTVFFEIVWFFSKWQRVTNTVRLAHEEKEEKRKRLQQKQTMGRSGDKENTVIGGVNKGNDKEAKEDDTKEVVPNETTSGALYDSLTVTMDVFMFSMMTSSMETYMQQKKYEELAQTVTLYVECIHILHGMMHVSKDEVEQMMSLGIQFKLFYDNEPLDKLPQLLKGWEEGLFTKQYTCDLVELCHMTLKLLEANKGSSSSEDADEGTGKVNGRGRRTKKKKSKKHVKDGDDAKKDRMTQMKDDAAEFDVFGYVGQLVTSEKIVTGMYTHLLSRYHNNDPYINHHIVAFLLRVCRFKIYTPPTSDDNEQQPLVSLDETNTTMEDLSYCLKKFERYCHRSVTLEPVLYNVRLLRVLSDILNDVTLRGNKELTYLKQFAASVVRHFAEAARHNPLLIVDMLFKHLPNAPDYCENITNLYVGEELRNIVTKHILHEGMGTSSLSTSAVTTKTTKANTDVDDTSGSRKIVERESDSEGDEEQEFVEDEEDKEYHPTSSKKAKKKRSMKKRKATKRDGSDNDDDDDDASSTASNDEFPLGPRGARFSKKGQPTKKSKKMKGIPKKQPSKRFKNNEGLSSDSDGDDDETRSRNSENEGDDSSTGSTSSAAFPMGPRARLQKQQQKRRKLSKEKPTATTTTTTSSSSDEEEFDAATTTSHSKSKEDDTKDKTANNDDSEKDDENLDDGVDDKWNDRRKFVPPSKKTTENNHKDETTDNDDSKTNNDVALNETLNDDASSKENDENSKKIMPSDVARSSKNEADNDDDDDEDDEDNKHTESQFSMSLVKTTNSTTNIKKRLKRPLAAITENDSDDDDLF